MFENATLFALLKGKNTEIRRIPIELKTLNGIRNLFSQLYADFVGNKTEVEYNRFNGAYAILDDDDEIFKIDGFEIHNDVIKAVRNVPAVTDFVVTDKIKALFIGEIVTENDVESVTIIFQKFEPIQYIATGKKWLVLKNNVFEDVGNKGLIINESITAVYVDGKLNFIKPFFTKQIFSLSKYYKEATDADIEEFANMSRLNIGNKEIFVRNTESQRNRKRIISIKNSRILDDYTSSEIQDSGKEFGIKINIKDDKIIVPDNKKELNELLRFLAEDIFKGTFTNIVYKTNSKMTETSPVSTS